MWFICFWIYYGLVGSFFTGCAMFSLNSSKILESYITVNTGVVNQVTHDWTMVPYVDLTVTDENFCPDDYNTTVF